MQTSPNDTHTHANIPPPASENYSFLRWAVMPSSSAAGCDFKRDTRTKPTTTMHVPYPSTRADLK